MVRLSVRRLVFSYGRNQVLAGIDLSVRAGEMVGVIGPNGAGKSTLLRCISGYLVPSSGSVEVDGLDISGLSRMQIARLIAVVPQRPGTEFGFTVEEMVMMGRFPYIDRWKGETSEDRRVVEEAMAATGVQSLRERIVWELSGGELQRVIVARALAQASKVLLLDEPTSALDINHQVEVFNLLTRFTRERGLATVAALHDLNLASLFCDRVVVISGGRIAAAGSPLEVLREDLLSRIYGGSVGVEVSGGIVRVYPVRHADSADANLDDKDGSRGMEDGPQGMKNGSAAIGNESEGMEGGSWA